MNSTDGIRGARQSLGMTQEALAESVGCSVDYVRLLERGYVPRFSDVLPRLLDRLGLADSEGGE
ncbi:MAG: helix-turn-helix domain-containing protein [Solirubrobacteraceae bacterium]